MHGIRVDILVWKNTTTSPADCGRVLPHFGPSYQKPSCVAGNSLLPSSRPSASPSRPKPPTPALCSCSGEGGLGRARLGQDLTWSSTHGPCCLPCLT